jgi:hypothetical protein
VRLYEVTPDDWGEVWPFGHGRPSRTVTFGEVEIRLSAGSQDYVSFYRDRDAKEDLWVVTRNVYMPYLGVEYYDLDSVVYDPDDKRQEADRSTFWQHEEQAIDAVGPKGFDYADYTIIRRVAEAIW